MEKLQTIVKKLSVFGASFVWSLDPAGSCLQTPIIGQCYCACHTNTHFFRISTFWIRQTRSFVGSGYDGARSSASRTGSWAWSSSQCRARGSEGSYEPSACAERVFSATTGGWTTAATAGTCTVRFSTHGDFFALFNTVEKTGFL